MSTVTEPSAVWAYAVAEHVRPAGLDELEGVGGGPVRAVTAAGLTAIAGDVPAGRVRRGRPAPQPGEPGLAGGDGPGPPPRDRGRLPGRRRSCRCGWPPSTATTPAPRAALTERAGDSGPRWPGSGRTRNGASRPTPPGPAGPGAAGDPDPAPRRFRAGGRRLRGGLPGPAAPGTVRARARPPRRGGQRRADSGPAWPPAPTRRRLHPPQSPQLAGHSAQMIAERGVPGGRRAGGGTSPRRWPTWPTGTPGGADRDHRPVAAVLVRRPAEKPGQP